MGIFGERCLRCGERRTRREFEGLPTCEDCEERLRSAAEPSRRCPDDAAEMRKEVVAGVVIDRCTACGGVWLDAGELRLLRRAAQGEGVAQALTAALVPLY